MLFEPASDEAPEADSYPKLEAICERYLLPEEMAKVESAYEFAARYHANQRRRSGEPYINHPV